jgi:hypothetical protein
MKTDTKLIIVLGFLFSTGASAAPAASPPPAQKIDWDKMTKSERGKYMKTTILPEMKKLFVAADPKRYHAMTCQTCHGSKAAAVKYKMPNPQLPKLPQPTDRAGFMALQQKKPDATKFMGTKVKPTMAALLGEPEWSPATPKGFGCYECHTQETAPKGAAAPEAAATKKP